MKPVNSMDTTVPHRPNAGFTARHRTHIAFAPLHLSQDETRRARAASGPSIPPQWAFGRDGQRVGTPEPNPPAAMRVPPPSRPRYLDIVALTAGMFFLGIILLALFIGLFMLLAGSSRAARRVVVQSLSGWHAPVEVRPAAPEAAIATLNATPLLRPITLYIGQQTITVMASDLGIQIDGEATAYRAAQAEQGIIAPSYRVNRERARAALTELSKQVNIPQTGQTPGRALNIAATLESLTQGVEPLMHSGALNLIVDELPVPYSRYIVQSGDELALIAKRYRVAMQSIMTLNNLADPNWIYPGQVLIIPAPGVWQPGPQEAPPAPIPQGRAIVVSLSQQRIYAYENGQLVRSALVSTGLPGLDAATGDYHVYDKQPSVRMAGPGYDIPNAPFALYFLSGCAIHGANWHNVFGRRANHGCVSLPVEEARWFYEFAPLYTHVQLIP